jgi:hypothetical protein
MSETAAEVAERYFTAWEARDEKALMQILAEDVTLRGPFHLRDRRMCQGFSVGLPRRPRGDLSQSGATVAAHQPLPGRSDHHD